MSEQELSRLLIKIAGIVIATHGIILLSYQTTSVLAFLGQPIERSLLLPQFWVTAVFPPAVSIAIGIWLYRRSARLVSRFPAEQTALPDRNVGAAELEQTALAVLGVYLLADGSASVLSNAGISLFYSLQTPAAWWTWPVSMVLPIVSDVARIAIGLWLFFRGHVVVSFRRGFGALRTLGRD